MTITPQVKKSNDELFFIRCSFCGWEQSTGDLIIGPRISICKSCVELAAQYLNLFAPFEDARDAIESIEGQGMTCEDCETYSNEWSNGHCRVHQITREWMLKYPKENK